MQSVTIGNVTFSRFLLGSNPFSGYSHQSPAKDEEMKDYYSSECIKAVLREAESLGITAVVGRTDYHIIRLLREYWNDGGTLQ